MINRTPEQEKQFNGLRSFAETYGNSTLDRERSLAGLEKLIRKVELTADRSIENLERARPVNPVKCAAGCWHCCTQLVAATVPEVLTVASYVREHFSESEQAEVRNRLRAYREENAHWSKEERGDYLRTKCPLLKGDLCGVFEARPLVCRGFNSTDVDACIRIKNNPGKNPVPVRSTSQLEVTFALREGVRDSLQAHDLASDFVELSLALEIALQDGMPERYLAGEDVFASARM